VRNSVKEHNNGLGAFNGLFGWRGRDEKESRVDRKLATIYG